MRTLLALALIVAAAPADAGRLFKCIGADGVTVYQQTTCAAAQQDAGVRTFQRGPDAPEAGWAGQQAAQQPEIVSFPPQQPAAAPRRRQPSINPMSAEAEALRRAQHRAGTPEGRAINRALYGSSQPSRPPTTPSPMPTTVTDQHGNRYQQPPGSAFVTDEKTGRQCFKNGAFLHCQ